MIEEQENIAQNKKRAGCPIKDSQRIIAGITEMRKNYKKPRNDLQPTLCRQRNKNVILLQYMVEIGVECSSDERSDVRIYEQTTSHLSVHDPAGGVRNLFQRDDLAYHIVE